MRALLLIGLAWLLSCGPAPEDDGSNPLLDVTAQNNGPGATGSFGGEPAPGWNGAQGGDTGLPANMRPMTAP